MNFIDIDITDSKFKINDVEFYNEGLRTINKAVVGIRAEKMISGSSKITVQPLIIEMSGGERIIYFTLNDCRCSARVPLDYACGDNIELKLSVSDMYFFDKVSGERIL